ncbi:hypothetical protein CHS0354_020495 [Potamilus streckersoni]|uniref:CCR4-NOT transcription complex subunit 1-like NOT1 connector domain-containing protein n=1 Tax=Potamilus streckersoni TaxID=2493646 RepID=A0AAE0SZ28_9BIVA|nr:hypothetical protein CHS0354_020495 [Potamilus streckersoni]
MAQYDMGLVKLMEDGLNSMAVEFAMKLVQCYCINRGIKSLVTVPEDTDRKFASS